ncbi:MAG: ankyrin repeat domain-containing protein, partial [Planctomycetaceae bacterium]|nr:ankyrin repeat domain-containing protein [Planctomycetaceae bacterium]
DHSNLIYEAMWRNRKMLQWLLMNGVKPDSPLAGNTPLMSAAADGDLKAIELLLQFGANVNARNEENEVPLGYACSWKQWPAAELLIKNGANVNAIENEGRTHLDWLILSEETSGAALLRSYGALTYRELESQKGM